MNRRLATASVIVAVAAIAVLAVVLSRPTNAFAPRAIAYVPIDSRVFVNRSTVQRWVSAHNETAVSNHAVALWNGLTATTNQTYRGTQLSVFDTWYTPCEIYPRTPKCGHGIIHKPTFVDLEVPDQFIHTPRVTGSDIFSGVRYNTEMKDFVDTGFNGQPYTSGAGLVAAMKAKQTDLVDTALPSAMMLKPAYELVSGTQPTLIGYWAGPGLNVRLGSSTSIVADVSTWLKAALVDPTGKATNDKPRKLCANTLDINGNVIGHKDYVIPAGSYPVIPLKEFYSVPLAPADMAVIRDNRLDFERQQYAQLFQRYGARAAKADPGCTSLDPVSPVAALVAMHVVSAELIDVWTWQTFWWTPTAKPIPGARGPFRHFDYATAYWTVDKAPYGWRYAFNPYLEAGFGTDVFITPAWPAAGQRGSVINLGRTTNCISCHQQATYTLDPKPKPTPGYVAHDDEPQVTTSNSILTRNLWSLAIRAGHPSPNP